MFGSGGWRRKSALLPKWLDPKVKKPLTIFNFELKTWPEFCVIQGDRGLCRNPAGGKICCTAVSIRCATWRASPCRRRNSTPSSAKDFCIELIRTGERRAVQDAINRYFPITPGFFGASKSKNNETYLRCGLKSRTNDEMRADFLRSRERTGGEGFRFEIAAI